MLRIIKVRFQGLWNSEYPLVVNRLIDIVEAHDLDALYLRRSFDRLAAFRPLLAKIEIQERSDRDSALLSELDQQRDTLFSVIRAVAKAFQRAPIGEISNHAHRIMTVLKKHGNDIPVSNYTAETKRLYDLISDFSTQPSVMDSLAELSLLPLLELMETVNREFDLLFMERTKRQSEIERVDIRAIRLQCDAAIIALWSAIEFCMIEYGADQYAPLINTINRQNAYYKQQLTARATRRRAKKEVSRETDIIPYTLEEQ
jgi:hypothetical protein